MRPEEFAHEYDLDSLETITPKGCEFQMLVTPRYISHYCAHSYEEFTSDLLRSIASDNLLFIDIGAHYGYYTLLVGTAYPSSRIIAVEPVPENYEILRRNIELNQLENVRVYNTALSDRNETRQFNIADASDSSGFYEHPLTRTSRVVELNAVALDSLVDEVPEGPIIVKMDTEGHELHVLKGMRRLLKESKDITLIMEFNPKCLRKAGHEPENLLEEVSQLGFDIYAIDDSKRMTYGLEKDGVDTWISYLPDHDEKRTANLLCIRKKISLSVCLFSHSAQLDAASTSILGLARQLVHRGAVCSVVLPGQGPLREELDSLGVSTLVVEYRWWCDPGPVPDDQIRVRLSNSFEVVIDVLARLGKINPDVVLTNTLHIPWGAVVASLLGKPHVWFVHEPDAPDFYLPLGTVSRFVRDSCNLTLVAAAAVGGALMKKLHLKEAHIVGNNLTDEKTGTEVVELLRRLNSRESASFDRFWRFAAQAIVRVLRTRAVQIAERNLRLKSGAARIGSLEASLHRKDARITSLETSLHRKDARITSLETSLQQKDARIRDLELDMRQIEQSIPTQLVRRYQVVLDRLLRPGTRSRRPYDLALMGVRLILNEGWKSFFMKTRAYLTGRRDRAHKEAPNRSNLTVS